MNLWKLIFWSLGGIALAVWIGYVLWHWRRIRGKKADPLAIALEEIFAQFALPLTQVLASFAFLIAMGMTAGSQFSIVLFVILSALTISGLGLLLWRLWPRDDPESNVFDLLSIPPVAWPPYETPQDTEIRLWVQDKAHQVKIHPPDFLGSQFGAFVLEIAGYTAKVYQKKTLLSLSLTDILRGLERTAADMKIISNQLPFAGHLTLADFERQIAFAIQRGKWFYGMLLLSFSLFNPGNLLRVFLLIFQKKSPWEHMIYELRGWVFSHYVERLGYHMALIYSHRQPPPPSSISDTPPKAASASGSSLRAFKLGSLATLSLLGTAFYLGLQILNSYLVYGGNGLILCLAALAVLLAGIAEMRAPQRWKIFWKALLPAWPAHPPAYTPEDLDARSRMDRLLYDHRSPPKIFSSEDLNKLPSFYGEFLWKLWQSCFEAYRHPDDGDPYRASREFYLPQAFAGIELLSRDLGLWYESQSVLPKVIRTLESYGLNLEKLYLFLDAKSRITPAASPDKPDRPDKDAPLAAFTETLSKAAVTASKTSFWGMILGGAFDVAKTLAIAEAHKRLLAFLRDKLGERLIDIYGARIPASFFLYGASVRFSKPPSASASTPLPLSASTPPPPSASTPPPPSASTPPPPSASTPTPPSASTPTPPSASTPPPPSASTPPPPSASTTPPTTLALAAAPNEPGGKGLQASSEGVAALGVEAEPPKDLSPEDAATRRPAALGVASLGLGAESPKEPSGYVLLLGREKSQIRRCLEALVGEGLAPLGDSDGEAFASSEPWAVVETMAGDTLGICVGTWLPKSEGDDAKILTSLIASHPYQLVLLADWIDYGAREQITFFLRDGLFPALRRGSVGPLCLLLFGVEKLKPLSWNPPYDGYKDPSPSGRKEERIRQALLAWQDALSPVVSVPFDDLYPLGIPNEGQPWGVLPLRQRLNLRPK